MNIINSILVKIISLVPRRVVRIFAQKYIAGEALVDGTNTVKLLNERNIFATMDVLGESIKNKEEAIQSKEESLEVLDEINKLGLKSNLSVKLSMLGLEFDYGLTLNLFTEILQRAKLYNNFVRIDMEDSTLTEKTIKIYEEVRERYENVGLVLQAYLKRTKDDIIRLTKQRSNFRLCKGIYIEPEKIAFKGKQEIRDNYLSLSRLIIEKGAYIAFATHDDFLINGCKKIVKENNLQKDRYEFQMLLGVREKVRDQLVEEGYKMRIYVPFGKRWYEYSIRRFKENPNVAGQVLKSIFTRN